jgi:hypothetical protein
VSAGAGASWLGVAPLEAQTPATIALRAFPAGLPVGTHATRLLLTSAEAQNTPLSLPVTLTVTRAGSIGGRVGDPAGNPIPGAMVTLQGARSRRTTTDAAGAYAFAQLPPGRYAVEVSGTGHPMRQSVKSVSLAEGEQATLAFLAVSHAIGGRVTDAAGKPIPRVAVRLHDASGVLLRQALTDARGVYAFKRLGPGSYTLRARLRPWRFEPAPRTVRIRDASLSGRDFIGRR